MLSVVTISLCRMKGWLEVCVHLHMYLACVHECIGNRTKESEDLPKAIQLGNIFHLITLLSLVMTTSD